MIDGMGVDAAVCNRSARIVGWAIGKVESEYPDDVCLLIVYGSYVNRTEGPLSDVDFYYVPASERAGELCRTFIVEDIGYDLFPIDWQGLEGLSMLDEPLVPLLGASEIAYCRSPADRRRFEGLRDTLRRNLADTAFMHRKAVDALSRAAGHWARLLRADDLCTCRSLAGGILLGLSDAVAYENQTYYHYGLKAQPHDLRAMERLPDGFLAGYLSLPEARTVGQIREACDTLIATTGTLIGCDVATLNLTAEPDVPRQEPRAIDWARLAEDYGETLSTFNKVYASCDRGDAMLAFISAVCLQDALDDVFSGIHLDVLSAFDAADLPRYAEHVRAVEAQLVAYIERGASITRYPSVDAFLGAN